MNSIAPIYIADNTTHAYQLNWSLSLFPKSLIPPVETWLNPLKQASESDSVRILEARSINHQSCQFLVSTKPNVSPSDVVRSIKGRLQHLLQTSVPKAFQRNYGIYSVGESNLDCLSNYVAKQPSRHPMAADHIQHRIESFQFLDKTVNLRSPRASSHGRYLNNVHIVLENRERLHDVSEKTLASIRSMIMRSCAKKEQLLSRIGIVSNHLHILMGCSVDESPREVALALMNNISYALGMKPVLEFSYYVGTFGPYDRGAIRKENC
jgi:REP element-mobilizing transposase RayT